MLSSKDIQDRIENQPADNDEDNKFTTLRNLSKADFWKVINFSLKNTAEAAIAMMQNVPSNQVTPISSSKTASPFNCHVLRTVFLQVPIIPSPVGDVGVSEVGGVVKRQTRESK